MTTQTLHMTAPPETYVRRRRELAAKLRRPFVLFAGQGRARQHPTNMHPFRAGSSFLYFGGPPISGAALLIEPESDGASGCSLVRSVPTFDDLVWIGATPDDEHLSAASGVPVGSLITTEQLAPRLSGRGGAHIGPPCPPTSAWIETLGLSPAEPDEMLAIIDLRLILDEHELDAMRFAAKVGVAAQLAAMKATKSGRRESDVVAAMTAVYLAEQCSPSFTPIVTVRGEILHSEVYPNTLEAGQLLLVDAGAEEPGGYASDITRTYPVTGEFTSIQRQLFDTVLRAERKAIAACVAHRRYRDIHDLAAKVICEGLVEADLLRGDPPELAARGAHTLFMTHGLGHLIGLDVHDMEDFGDLAGYAPGRQRRTRFGSKFLRLDRDLAPGMAVTIEPGVYFVPALWQNKELTAPLADAVNRTLVDTLLDANFGGIRIEDTVHIRDPMSGPETLTAALPSDADAITEIVRGD